MERWRGGGTFKEEYQIRSCHIPACHDHCTCTSSKSAKRLKYIHTAMYT